MEYELVRARESSDGGYVVDGHSGGDKAEVLDFAVIRLVFGFELIVLVGLILAGLGYLLLVKETGVGVFCVSFKVLERDHLSGF